MRKSKKFAITKLVLISVAVCLVMLLAVAQFGVPFTNYNYKSFAGAIKRGFDFDGGIYALYDVDSTEDTTNLEERLLNSVVKLNDVLADSNLSDSTVAKVGESIRVEASALNSPTTLLQLIGSPAKLEFQVGGVTKLTNKNVDKAYVSYDQSSSQYGIMVEFDQEGKQLYKELTTELKKTSGTITVAISGNNISSVTINSITVSSRVTDGKQMLLSTSFSTNLDTAATVAIQIMSGALDVNLTLNKMDEIESPMGAHAKAIAIVAGVTAVVAVIAWLIIRFRAMGTMSVISFVLFVSLYLLFLYSFPIGQLTLLGVVGIFGGIAMAVSVYFLLYRKFLEEYALGKTVNASLTGAYSKTLWQVLDSNILVTLVGAFFIILGGAAFKTLGIVLIMGIILSLLTSLLVNRFLIRNLIAITPENMKAYNLSRDEGVEEIPDEQALPAKQKKAGQAAVEAEVVESEPANGDEAIAEAEFVVEQESGLTGEDAQDSAKTAEDNSDE